MGNSLANLEFIISNPSKSKDYYLISASCFPEKIDLFSTPPLENYNILPNQNIEIPRRGGLPLSGSLGFDLAHTRHRAGLHLQVADRGFLLGLEGL